MTVDGGQIAATGEDRYGQIVLAGYQLLDEGGLDGLTVRAVLKAAGVNRRAFYAHFADKDALVLAVFSRSIQLLTAECRLIVRGLRDPVERLHRIVDFIVIGGERAAAAEDSHLRRSAALCREHMRLAEARPADLKRVLEPFIGLFAALLAEGMDEGSIRRDDPEQLANLVYNAVSTTVHAATLAQEQGGRDPGEQMRLAQRIWEFCRRGIMA